VEKEELVNLVESRLSKYKHRQSGGITEYFSIPAEEILSVDLPQEILKLRQNYSPSVGDFLEIAKEFSAIEYDLYVVDEKSREDYGDIVITAVNFPLSPKAEKGIKELLLKAKSKPDEDEVVITKDKVYRKIWWD
jgi:hypothetical protein